MENAYKRKKEPELNKQLILDAATEIGAAGDWHDVTFQAIADKTGLSKGGIIHHFKNKDELLDELMKRSLAGLTEWMQVFNEEVGNGDKAYGYLKFVIDKSNDAQYQKLMSIVIKSILASPQYRKWWEEWYQANIMPPDGTDVSIHSLIMLLVADGIWYSEGFGFSVVNDETKQKILKHLKR
nr:TetR/AcrR family transcriptional regulator [uncultured Chitinophaga sp.]